MAMPPCAPCAVELSGAGVLCWFPSRFQPHRDAPGGVTIRRGFPLAPCFEAPCPQNGVLPAVTRRETDLVGSLVFEVMRGIWKQLSLSCLQERAHHSSHQD